MSARTIFLAVFATTVFLCGHGALCRYTANVALSAFQFSKASYCNTSVIEQWNCCSCGANPFFHNITTENTYETFNTQMYTGVTLDRIVVAFRGSLNIENWLTNMHFSRKAYTNDDCTDCTVHSGFLNAYNGFSNLVEEVTDLITLHPNHSVLITGHSLGGALATFAAADIAYSLDKSNKKAHIELYTFGSPRLGNQAFADWFAKLFCRGGHESYRVTSRNDMIPQIPHAFLGFVHVGHEMWHTSYEVTKWKSCKYLRGNTCDTVTVEEDDTCNNNAFPGSASDHMWYFGKWALCSCDKAWPFEGTCDAPDPAYISSPKSTA